MNNWPMHSVLCNKNRCQIIPFCRKGKKHWLWLGQKNAPKRRSVGIYGQHHTMTLNTQMSWTIHRRHHQAYLNTYNFCNLCFATLTIYRKSKNTPHMLSSAKPLFNCPLPFVERSGRTLADRGVVDDT